MKWMEVLALPPRSTGVPGRAGARGSVVGGAGTAATAAPRKESRQMERQMLKASCPRGPTAPRSVHGHI